MKVFRIVLVLCVLNTFIIAQEDSTKKESTEPSQATTDTQAINNASTEKMSQDVKSYFTREKEVSLYYMGAGAFTTAMGLYYRNQAVNSFPDPTRKYDAKSETAYNLGLSYPLIGVGVFQLATGGFMYFKSDKKAKDLEKELEASPASFREQELTRMENVAYWNKMFTYADYAMIGGGLWAYYAGTLSDKKYMIGLGTGLVIQGLVSLALDYFANKRADGYREKLINFNFSYLPASKNQNAYAINGLGANGTSLNEGYYMFSFSYKLK
jgi:uncharacterized protein (DUF2164 family)